MPNLRAGANYRRRRNNRHGNEDLLKILIVLVVYLIVLPIAILQKWGYLSYQCD